MVLVEHEGLTDFLTGMFEGASDGLCLVAPDDTVLRVNARWLRSTGFRSEQVVGADFVELFPQTRALTTAVFARARAGERVAVPRHRQLISGQESFWDGCVAPVKMQGGVGLLVTARELLAPGVEQAQAVFASLEVGVLVMSGEGAVVAANAAVRRLLELDDDQLARRRPPAGWGLFLEDGRAVDALEPEERRRLRALPGTRVRVQLPDGRRRWIATTTTRLAGLAGDPDATLTTFIDVTEAQRAERERHLLGELVRGALDGILVTDADLRIVEYGGGAARIFGWTREEVLGKRLVDFPHEFPDGDGEVVGDRLARGLEFRARMRGLRKDGAWAELDLATTPLRDGLGGLTGWLVVARDVGPQVAAERALRERQAVLDTYFRTPAIGIAFAEKGVGVLDANPAFCAMLGYTQDELRGMDWRRFTHPDDVAPEEVAAGRLLRGEVSSYALEKRYVRRDGTTFWGLLSLSAVREEGTGHTKVLGMVKDIEQRKRAELALAASEATLARVLEGSGDGSWDWHVPSGHVTYSDRWASMLGYAVEELQPDVRTWERLVHPDDRPAVEAALKPHLEGSTPRYECEHRVRRKDGSWAWILDRGRVVERGPDGAPIRVAGTHSDITRRREAEAALREASAANEQLVRELKDALAHVKTLSGLLPMCMHCHKIRDDQGYWDRIDEYISERTDAEFSHGLCPDCLAKHYPDA